MINAKLVVVGGDAKSGEVRLKLPTIIGRGKEAGLTVPHALVSRRHTEVFERDGKLFVRDLGSLNGTFVNNTRIDGEQELEPNQLLTLGNITFRAVYELGDPALQPADPETVAFDATITETTETLSAPNEQASAEPATQSPPIDFTEVAATPQPPAPAAHEPVSNGQPAPAANAPSVDRQPESAATPEPVAEESVATPSSEVTPAPVESPASDVLVIDGAGSRDQSFSASGIDNLVVDEQPVGFVSSLDLDSTIGQQQRIDDSVHIDAGQEPSVSRDVDSQAFGSFVNKLPR